VIDIPITLPRLRQPTIAKWGDPILMGDEIEESQRELWAWEPDRPETAEFIRLVKTSSNLVAVFCGHVHFAHEEYFSQSATQFVGEPAFDGGFRFIELRPQ
jgi:hypothetical protein